MLLQLTDRERSVGQFVIDHPGARLSVTAPLWDLPGCEVGIERVLASLAPLGPLGSLRVTDSWLPPGVHGLHSGDLALIDSERFDAFCRAENAASQGAGNRPIAASGKTIAHELAHQLFGAAVDSYLDEAADWWEAASSYVGLWPLSETDASAERRAALYEYAALGADDIAGMSQRVAPGQQARFVLSYRKGLLLFTALEDRIGKDRLVAALRRFVDDNRGHLGSWGAIVAAVRNVTGDSDAAWLETWLRRPGAPRLRWADVRVVDGRLRGVLVQDPPTWAGSVEIGFLDGGAIIGRHTVAFEAARTPFDLPVPAGADEVALDPRFRLPRLFDVEANPADVGLSMRLEGADPVRASSGGRR
jgi:hypothetical protein